MNREISKFVIPSASISAVAAVSMIISVIIYETMLVPMLRKATGNKRGINILPRICIGILFSIATMIVAALVEHHAAEKDPIKGSQSMSVLWLVPQFVIVGFGDGFTLVGLQEYFL
ncbi:hypothetical protein LWI29_014279 [Acer saccharum]|uniref:Uncharacterized protein n=1 Tax=Acer saccharum TaxID=4024 RepID=A0AA39S7F3_ACESA|nr:hypothetical protein LWI29_014279 [Acer saccharum]